MGGLAGLRKSISILVLAHATGGSLQWVYFGFPALSQST
jgi:hypothetical protein